LPQRLAACDLAVVQGGLATTMELVAAGRPFVWVPLREHCEQQLHVAHRLRRHGAPLPTAYEQTQPESLAALMLERLRSDVHYVRVDRGAAARAADAIAALLAEHKISQTSDTHDQQEVRDALHST
jgi:predicted glycosyltransferase